MNTLYSEIIDTHHLIERRTEIEAELEDTDPNEIVRGDLEEELSEIREIEDNISEFPYGETLIREDYFTEYAQQLAEDIGAINPDAQWPLTYIDWERAADALKMDYTTVEYRGNTYYARV